MCRLDILCATLIQPWKGGVIALRDAFLLAVIQISTIPAFPTHSGVCIV